MRVLRPYQKEGVRYGLKTQHPFLAWEMRLGKTLTCIRTIQKQSDSKLILVIGPFAAIYSWITELNIEHEKSIFLYGSRDTRLSKLDEVLQYPSGRIWALINKEGYQVIPEIAGTLWDTVIWDESIFLSNPGTKISKFFLKYFRSVKHRWALCGTPASESPLQWYNQLTWLDRKMCKEKNYYSFRHKHFIQDKFEWILSGKGEKYLAYILDHNVSILKRKDVNLGGSKIRQLRYVELPKKIRKMYNKSLKSFFFEYDGILHRSIYATQHYIWLRKFCSGFNSELNFASYHKCTELWNLIQNDFRNESLVIWCHFVDDVCGVYWFLKDKGISVDFIYGDVIVAERERKRQQFQEKKIQILVILTQTMSFSANLSAASALIYFSHNESGKIRSQSEDRHLDQFSHDGLLIIDLICIDTIEEDILNGYDQKELSNAGVNWILNALKKRRNEL